MYLFSSNTHAPLRTLDCQHPLTEIVPTMCFAPSAGKWNADWKRRFFVLAKKELVYYEDERQAKRKGAIDLANATELRPYSGTHTSKHTWPPSTTRFEVVTADRTWVLSSGDRCDAPERVSSCDLPCSDPPP